MSRWSGDLYKEPSVAAAMDAYANRRRAIEAGTIATQMGTTLLIAAIILFIGDRVLTGDASWAHLVTYITLLRVASGNFSGIARRTTTMARLYPQVQDFVAFVHGVTRPAPPEHLESLAWALHIEVEEGANDNRSASSGAITIERGCLIAIVTRDPRWAARPDFAVALAAEVRRSQLSEDVASAAEPTAGSVDLGTGGGTLGAVVLVACGRLQTGTVTTREMLGLPADLTTQEWRAALDELRRVRPDLGDDIDACAKADLDGQPGPLARIDRLGLIAQIAAALVRRASVVILERDALKVLDCRSAADPLVGLLQRDRLVMIWYQADQVLRGCAPDYGEQTALVCAGTSIKVAIDLAEPGASERLAASLTVSPGKADGALSSTDQNLDEALSEMD